MANPVSEQDEPNLDFDWLSERAICHFEFFGRSGLPLCPAEDILNPSLTKLARAAWLEITIYRKKKLTKLKQIIYRV